MQTYTLKTGSIAAVAYLECPNGQCHQLIYLNEKHGVVGGSGPRDMSLTELGIPKHVQLAVRQHFMKLFAMNVVQRGEAVREMDPVHIEDTFEDVSKPIPPHPKGESPIPDPWGLLKID